MSNPAKDVDPRGLIFESFRIDGITEQECRSIFFDWALGLDSGENLQDSVRRLHQVYAAEKQGHPMVPILEEGLNKAATPTRRRGRHRQGA